MPPKKKEYLGLEKRLEDALFMDKDMIKFFKNQNENKFKKDKIIDITGTTFQSDLISMPIDDTVPYRYILTLVNITNNYVYAQAIEKKDAVSVLNGFKFIMDRFKPNIKVLQTDHGSEFKNTTFNTYCAEKNIMHIYYNLYNKNSMGIVENMNGLISKMIYRTLSILTLKDKKTINTDHYNVSWTGLLRKVINAINQYNTEKYGITGKYTLQDVKNMLVNVDKDILKIGDIVYLRIQKPTSIVDGKKFFGTFRHGDNRFDYLKPQKVTSRLIRSGRTIRYYLDDDEKVSYKRSDLLKK